MSTIGDERGLQLLELTPWKRGRGNQAGGNSFGSGGDGLGGPDPSQVDPVVGIIPHFSHGVSQPDPWTKKHVKNHG